MFTTYPLILLSLVILTACFVTLVTRKSPFLVAANFIDQLFLRKHLFFLLLGTLLILLVNKLELYAEHQFVITRANFTHTVFQFEGAITGFIQNSLQSYALTYVLTFFYVIVFPSMILASLFIYVYKQDEFLTTSYFYTLMLNYALALPFYLFFPVDEVWVYHRQVEFLIPQVYPNFNLEYRPLSGINNCVPSLHTSISVSMAFLAFYSGMPVWKWITTASALLIVFSTNYLGIHWFVDIIAGILLAVISCSAALLISRGTTNAYLQTYFKSDHETQVRR